MLPAYRGRINRKSFVAGNVLGIGLLGFAALIYIVPIAIIDILITSVANFTAVEPVFKVLYSLFLIPAVFYFFYFSVLFVKRIHDIGYPGILLLWLLIGSEVAARVLDISLLNLLGVAIVALAVVVPGQKIRNKFGAKPTKRFNLKELSVKF